MRLKEKDDEDNLDLLADKGRKGGRVEKYWKNLMNVEGKKGFYFEILTMPVPQSDPKFNTFSTTDPNFRAYVNLGFWRSIEDFERAVQETMPKASRTTDQESGKTKHSIELEDFEFKLRERIVLTPIAQRGGKLPDVSDLEQAGMELLVHKMAG